MITFTNFLENKQLLEMPHIVLDGPMAVDLELEVHSKMKADEFINYIEKWLDGEPIKSKTSGLIMQINKRSIRDFAEKVHKNQFFKLFVVKNYGESVWNKLNDLLQDSENK